MLKKIGLKEVKRYVKIREIYKIHSISNKNNKKIVGEIIFDHFPGLKPYMEIETINENELEKWIEYLKIKPNVFSIKDVYKKEYNIQGNNYLKINFESSKEQLKTIVNKNLEIILSILEKQKETFFNLINKIENKFEKD